MPPPLGPESLIPPSESGALLNLCEELVSIIFNGRAMITTQFRTINKTNKHFGTLVILVIPRLQMIRMEKEINNS
ncbi:uncharacterized protein DS421_5g139270 [Arachis hypogaea]|nr:uncharacterized protein DS421_5g139270 [Arachis hypogaea]